MGACWLDLSAICCNSLEMLISSRSIHSVSFHVCGVSVCACVSLSLCICFEPALVYLYSAMNFMCVYFILILFFFVLISALITLFNIIMLFEKALRIHACVYVCIEMQANALHRTLSSTLIIIG